VERVLPGELESRFPCREGRDSVVFDTPLQKRVHDGKLVTADAYVRLRVEFAAEDLGIGGRVGYSRGGASFPAKPFDKGEILRLLRGASVSYEPRTPAQRIAIEEDVEDRKARHHDPRFELETEAAGRCGARMVDRRHYVKEWRSYGVPYPLLYRILNYSTVGGGTRAYDAIV